MSFKAQLNVRVKIYRGDVGSGYNPDVTWSLLRTVDGAMKLLKGEEKLADDGKAVIADTLLFIEITDIDEEDRIKIGDYYYEIDSIYNPHNLDHHYEIKILRLPPGTADDMGL